MKTHSGHSGALVAPVSLSTLVQDVTNMEFTPTGTPGWSTQALSRAPLVENSAQVIKSHSVLYPKCQVLIPPVPWRQALTLILHMMPTGSQRNHQQSDNVHLKNEKNRVLPFQVCNKSSSPASSHKMLS